MSLAKIINLKGVNPEQRLLAAVIQQAVNDVRRWEPTQEPGDREDAAAFLCDDERLSPFVWPLLDEHAEYDTVVRSIREMAGLHHAIGH